MPPRILLITNIPSHHQIAFGEALHRLLGDRFRLAIIKPVSAERRELGWRDASRGLPFVIRAWDSKSAWNEMADDIRDFDAVIRGDAPASLVRQRIKRGKLTFCYTERIWKKGFWRVLNPRVWPALWQSFWSVNRVNHHLLAASAYCAWDLSRIGAFRNRMWKWGYFATTPSQPPPAKPRGTPRILWAGRMIRWKQAAHLVQAAGILKRRGMAFRMELIGDGPRRPAIDRNVRRSGLADLVALHRAMPPDRVREEMLASHIYVLPSSFQEGWGVVVNEAMASGCCVVSSHGAGAAPWLIRHGETGFLYPNGDVRALANILEKLLLAPEQCATIGRQAWEYVRAVWSPEAAAQRLLALCGGLLGAGPMPDFAEGPCSRAEVQCPQTLFRK